ERDGLRLRVAYARGQLGEVLERRRREGEALTEYAAAVEAVEQMAATLGGDAERDLFHDDAADRRLYARLVTLLLRPGRGRAELGRADAALASLVVVDRAAPAATARRLRRGELLLEYLVGEHETLIFARRRGGALLVRRSPVGAVELRQEVDAFRAALELGDD